MDSTLNFQKFGHSEGLESSRQYPSNRLSKLSLLTITGLILHILLSSLFLFQISVVNNRSYTLLYDLSEQVSQLADYENFLIHMDKPCSPCHDSSSKGPSIPLTSTVASTVSSNATEADETTSTLTTSIDNNYSDDVTTEITNPSTTNAAVNTPSSIPITNQTEKSESTEPTELPTTALATSTTTADSLTSESTTETSEILTTVSLPPVPKRQAWEVLVDATKNVSRITTFECWKICGSMHSITIEAKLNISYTDRPKPKHVIYQAFMAAEDNILRNDLELAKSKVSYLALLDNKKYIAFKEEARVEPDWDKPTKGCDAPIRELHPNCF